MGSSQLQYTILPSSMKDMGVNLFIRQGSVSMSDGASPLHILRCLINACLISHMETKPILR